MSIVIKCHQLCGYQNHPEKYEKEKEGISKESEGPNMRF